MGAEIPNVHLKLVERDGDATRGDDIVILWQLSFFVLLLFP